MKIKKSIDIILATFNGEKYLKKQLDSILNQESNYDFKIIIRDDGSTDSTIDILEKYENKFPNKFKIIKDNIGKLGCGYNFLKISEYSNADYIFFSDQDDIWDKYKMQAMIKEMENNEDKYSDKTPIIIHSDLKIVDQDEKVMHESYNSFVKLNGYQQNRLNKLLIRNFPGCCMMINKSLLNRVLPYPKNDIYIHDIWFFLVASIFGKVIYLDQKLTYYRIHNNNTIGIGEKKGVYNKNIFTFINDFNHKKALFLKDNLPRIKVAEILLERYKDELDNKNKTILRNYIKIKNQNFFSKRINMISNGFLDQDPIMNLRMFMYY